MPAPPEGKECLGQAALRPEGQGPPLVSCLLGRVTHGVEGQRQLLVQHALQAGLQLQAVTGSKVIPGFCIKADRLPAAGAGPCKEAPSRRLRKIKLAWRSPHTALRSGGDRLVENTPVRELAFLEWSFLRKLWLCQW